MTVRPAAYIYALLAWCLAFATLLLPCPALQAQNVSTAQLSGTVRDPSGAVVPNATVVIADPTRGFTRTVVTGPQGDYEALLLPPGTYTVTVTAAGFAQLLDRNVTLTTGQQAELPLTLTIGSTTTVNVASNADIIETQRSSQSTTVD